jgi:hypothetical protein
MHFGTVSIKRIERRENTRHLIDYIVVVNIHLLHILIFWMGEWNSDLFFHEMLLLFIVVQYLLSQEINHAAILGN